MIVNGLPRDAHGRFMKGVGYAKGRIPSIETREKMRNAKLKKPTRYWKGKKRFIAKAPRQGSSGYRYIAVSLIEPEVKKYCANYAYRPIAEHNYVWCKHHNKSVPKGYVVHHINHIKNDNRISNLMLMEKRAHSSYHNKKK